MGVLTRAWMMVDFVLYCKVFLRRIIGILPQHILRQHGHQHLESQSQKIYLWLSGHAGIGGL